MQSEVTTSAIGWQMEHSFAQLPGELFTSARPAPVREPKLAILNERLADELGLSLNDLSEESLAAFLSGNQLPSNVQPIAQAYAGHQFGSFTMLGDGRAILLGEHRTSSGRLVDIQLKGSGRTRYSRGGDGRAALGPMLREYVISEAMHGLGIPTTRSLAVIHTGEPVYRESIRHGAILVRVAASHIRVGTFEYLAARRDRAGLAALADYSIERHYPEIANSGDKYRDFLSRVIEQQAKLIAQWQLVGFIHGVMNTDNMAISGETIDYGPCAFMNAYDPQTVFSSIDHSGRYAYSNQPAIAHWNLARFAETLLPLLADEPVKAIKMATETLHEFPQRFDQHWLDGMRRKLGLISAEPGDADLVHALLAWMHQSGADFTNTFRALSISSLPTAEPYSTEAFRGWHTAWLSRLEREQRSHASVFAEMQLANPYVIPRNHFVEEALSAAEDEGDLSPVNQLLSVLQSPFHESATAERYTTPPPNDCNYRTFCGT